MEAKQVYVIGNQLYYLDKGNLYPLIVRGGGGSGRGKKGDPGPPGPSGAAAPNYQATATDDIATSSTSDVVATGMTLTPPAGTYLVWFSGSTSGTLNEGSNAIIFMSIYSDGVKSESSEQRGSVDAEDGAFPFNCVAKVTVNGSQEISGRWRVDNAAETGTMHQRNITALKVEA